MYTINIFITHTKNMLKWISLIIIIWYGVGTLLNYIQNFSNHITNNNI